MWYGKTNRIKNTNNIDIILQSLIPIRGIMEKCAFAVYFPLAV